MLAGWLNTRLKSAQKALRQGRIDDAYAVAAQPDVRGTRDGQVLADELVAPLLARARLHAQAGRYSDAMLDLDRLAGLERSTPDAAELRQRVAHELKERHGRDAARKVAVERVQRDLADGRLDSMRANIERVQDADERARLADELDLRLRRGDEICRQAETALARGDALSALSFWRTACERHGRSATTDALGLRLANSLRDSMTLWFAEARLDRFLHAADAIEPLRGLDASLAEFERVAGLCRRAAEELASGNSAALRDTLSRLASGRAGVAWLDEARTAAGRMAEAREALLASPLGLFASIGPRAAEPAGRAPRLDARQPVALSGPVAGAAGQGVLMIVDGACSALLLSQDRVRIGRMGPGLDVPIPAGEVQPHHADVLRDGEDYFLLAYGPTQVNRRAAKRVLLRHGDRIALGPRVRVVFHRPSARSASAVLRIAHGARLAHDVSEIVLFRETCLIGPQASCHVRTSDGQSQVVIFEQDGRLMARHALGEQKRLGNAHPIAMGETADFGDVRVTFKAYDPRGQFREA